MVGGPWGFGWGACLHEGLLGTGPVGRAFGVNEKKDWHPLWGSLFWGEGASLEGI